MKQGSRQGSQTTTNYAQQLHGDLISQVLHGSSQSNLPSVPDSPCLQQQNMPKKKSIKERLSDLSRQNSSSSNLQHRRAPASNENHNSRNSSRSGAVQQQSSLGGSSQQALRMSEDYSGREVRRQKSRQSVGADSNAQQLPSRRQSSKGGGKLPPTHGGASRANSRSKLRGSMLQQEDAGMPKAGAVAGQVGPLPPRRPTQTSSARSLQPLSASTAAPTALVRHRRRTGGCFGICAQLSVRSACPRLRSTAPTNVASWVRSTVSL